MRRSASVSAASAVVASAGMSTVPHEQAMSNDSPDSSSADVARSRIAATPSPPTLVRVQNSSPPMR